MANPAYRQWMYVNNSSELPATADIGQFAFMLDSFTSMYFNGTTWLPLARVVVKKEANSINLKATGNTLMYTLESSTLNFYPVLVVPRAVNVGGVTLNATMSIGTNATAYDNIASASLIGNAISLLTGGNTLSTNTYSPALPAGAQIYAKVTVASIATNNTAKFDILGYYDV